MADLKRLSEHDAIAQIVETVRQAKPGTAPFALVLGSGFSHGLVPTARELVSQSLPLWMKSLGNGAPQDTKSQAQPAEEIARNFWKGFIHKNKDRGLVLPLEEQTGLPQSYADAYRAVFNPAYFGAVGAPAQAREFQRALMRLDKSRLNAAHFFLASLLGVQPGKSRPSDRFNAAAAFSRLILTTNFDPFLQTALQAVNRLYFMSDTPEVGVRDDILDDQIDAIHLVYVHGTIHRRSQAATDESIKALKEKNAQRLAPVLKRHGVIVLGYSGWDDAIVEALSGDDDFDHLLYWCGLEADPLANDAFGPKVRTILQNRTAFYVQIGGAGRFMAQLVGKLVKGVRLLDNPIAQIRDMLEMIDLSELSTLRTVQTGPSNSVPTIDSAFNAEAFVQAREVTLQRLSEAEAIFRGHATPSPDQPGPAPAIEAKVDQLEAKKQVQQLLASARVASAVGNHDDALKLCDDALKLALEPEEVADVLLARGAACHSLGREKEAISDWSHIIELPGAPIEYLAVALRNRSVVLQQQGDIESALKDATRVIEQLPGVPVEQLAAALVNRGFLLGNKGETEKELADYTRVIEELPGAPIEQVALALRNRGIAFFERGKNEQALANYTSLIELPNAPIQHLALALRNRGVIFGQQGQTDKELADYTRLIENLPSAPIEDIAGALLNRGIALNKRGQTESAVTDFSRLIESLPGAPSNNVAAALGNRGWIKYLKNDFVGFLSDTESAVNTLDDLDFVAFNLGLALLANGRDAAAAEAYERAARKFPALVDDLGLQDLKEATKSWLAEDRAKPVIELLESLKK